MVEHSVIIPTRNHPELLAGCLAALRSCTVQDDKGEWEALVLDNSDERYRVENAGVLAGFADTQERAGCTQKRARCARLRYLPMSRVGLMFARHEGVDAARGALISFIDDDTRVSETWLGAVQACFGDPMVGLVTGPNRPQYEHTPPAWLEGMWMKAEHGRFLGTLSLSDFGEQARVIPVEFVWGCNYSIRKDLFVRARGSHPDYLPEPWKLYQGDGEVGLSIKADALGSMAHYSPLCAIRHLVPAARMTEAYFVDRAFFVGMHMSFTAYRRAHGLGPGQGVALKGRSQKGTALSGRSAGTVSTGWLRRLLHRAAALARKAAGAQEQGSAPLRHLMQQRMRAGWDFHRDGLRNSAVLRAYVLRPDFMGENGDLPGVSA